MAHHHASLGRVSVVEAAEDDLFNRFMVLHKTLFYSKGKSFALVVSYLLIESLSNLLGALKRLSVASTFELLRGRTRGLLQIARVCLRNNIQNANDAVL